MSEKPVRLTEPPAGYAAWLTELKARIHTAQQRATLAVNRELVLLYWQIGRDILARQAEQGWGAKVIERLAEDLRLAFPEMKGFSPRNLKYMRAFAQAWPDEAIVQEALAQLPWYHHLALLDKLPDSETRRWYAAKAIEHNWSRNILVMQIETRLLERSGQAVSNFPMTLPKPQSDLARESLKDPYRFDFLGLTDEAQEREIEAALVKHVTEFLLELGAGFAFVGRQVLLDVGGDEFFIDLLFYHLKLRCYVVIELKGGKFKPEHLGQLGFYMTAVDRQIKHEQDNPTIGLLLCKSKNKVVAEYALGDKSQPMGIAEYKMLESLPAELQTSLPSIEQIERELMGG
ncbi:PDDEXK nuclease domain-containing protein [Rivihabitans pingtungensis]|jgi:predicted nuclease of restriction endonuclease-like (RecB) superfamily|uniref:PDDEXK nuclease domain-containing protein n=1 Tax=Rivihabitans pingtungensis TaxID=1054498 RepID=UPI00289858FE|nr:PDDEXK nuclease domain-containing protein [Rivihabitans pingtungensis]HNX71976.1 PDDEXK nuclease domain-containing protein [Rivihabitans pingtungensis]